MARSRSSLLEVAYVARPHGVRGELRAVPYDPDSESLLGVAKVAIGDDWYDIEQARRVKGAILLCLAGLRDRNQVESLRGRVISVDREEIPLAEGEVFLTDMIGCTVVLEDGTEYGTVAEVEAGPQDRLVIHHGDIERLLPLVPAFVLDIDLDEARIVVAPPEELPESPLR